MLQVLTPSLAGANNPTQRKHDGLLRSSCTAAAGRPRREKFFFAHTQHTTIPLFACPWAQQLQAQSNLMPIFTAAGKPASGAFHPPCPSLQLLDMQINISALASLQVNSIIGPPSTASARTTYQNREELVVGKARPP